MLPAVLALAFAALLPLGTARLLAAIFLQGAPAAGEGRARRLLPFRAAAFFVTISSALIPGAAVCANTPDATQPARIQPAIHLIEVIVARTPYSALAGAPGCGLANKASSSGGFTATF